ARLREVDRLDVRGRRKNRDDELAVPRGSGGGRGARGAGLDRAGQRGLDDVVGHDLVAVLHEVGQHRLAHRADSDESDLHDGLLRVPARRNGFERRYDRGVHRARQAPRTVVGLVLIALAAISWGTSGSVMTVLATRAGASPLLVGVTRLWIAAILLLA